MLDEERAELVKDIINACVCVEGQFRLVKCSNGTVSASSSVF